MAAGWQADAYAYVSTIGMLGYVVHLKANMLGRCELRAQVLTRDETTGKDVWKDTEDARCRRVVAAFRPPQGGQGKLLRQAALHREIAGECFLYGAPVVDELGNPGGLLWEFLSVLELTVSDGGRQVKRNRNGKSSGMGGMDDAPPEDAYVARFYLEDPTYSGLADSPVRRVIPDAKQVVLLTMVIEAICNSRLPNDLLYIPWEFSFGPEDELETEAADQQQAFDEFEAELKRHMSAPIEDRSAASSIVPLLMRGPAILTDGNGKAHPAKDLMGMVGLGRDMSSVYEDLRTAAYERIADGLDAPKEVAAGKGSLAGLGGGSVADSVDEDWLTNHIDPLADELGEFLTTAYFRPMLTEVEKMPRMDAASFRLVVDTSPVRSESDKTDAATTGVELGAVKDEAWRREAGFDDDDAPDADEVFRRTLQKLLLAQPTLGPAILPVLFPDRAAEMAPAFEKWDVGTAAPGGPAGQLVPKPLTPSAGSVLLAEVSGRTLGCLLGAVDREVSRAVERAANRVLGRLQGHERLRALRSAAKRDVLASAGPDLLAEIGMTSDDLFDGCWDELADRAMVWLSTDLIERGEAPGPARERATVATRELCAQLTLVAATAVNRPLRAGVNGMMVPTELVVSALLAGDMVGST